MKRIILALLLSLLLAFAPLADAKTAYHRTALTGGAASALDGIDGASLTDGDFAFVMAGSVLYTYILNATSGAAESSPGVIAPDTNAGNKRWILQLSYGYFDPASPGAIGITIDGGGSAIETGVKGYVTVPYDCTITGWHLTGAPSGSIVIDVWKAAGAIPTVANTIAGSEKPTLSSAQVASDTDLTTWTTAVSAGDVIGFNVDSCSSVERATLVLAITK